MAGVAGIPAGRLALVGAVGLVWHAIHASLAAVVAIAS